MSTLENDVEVGRISVSTSSGRKRRHKHKKKHRHHRCESQEDEEEVDVLISPPTKKPTIKLKFKFGGETVSEKSVIAHDRLSNISVSPANDDTTVDLSDDANDTSVTPSLAGNETSDEEKEWLTALEAGELDDGGMVRSSRDPNLMTARQRALVHGVKESDLQELPSGYKTPELTEEQMNVKQQKADKRKQMALEKREKDKKLTMDRLLKKQDAKLRVAKARVAIKRSIPRFQYKINQDSILLSVPHGYQLPFQQQIATPPPKAVMCGVFGCNNQKKYNCSKTGTPLCSLQCYKQNFTLNSNTVTLHSQVHSRAT